MSPAQLGSPPPLTTDPWEEWRRPGWASHRPPHSGPQRWDWGRRKVSTVPSLTALGFRPSGKGTERRTSGPTPGLLNQSAFAPGPKGFCACKCGPRCSTAVVLHPEHIHGCHPGRAASNKR